MYSGNAHLAYFDGSDTVIASDRARAVFASEHSVMSVDGENREFQTYERLIEKFPEGTLSLVSDTWNIWNVVDSILPRLKKAILRRKGKLMIRPDSGDPVQIVCGKPGFSWNDKSTWGVIHYLDRHFGHRVNKKGFKELNPKVGIIYGDAMTYSRTEAVLKNLLKQKYASSNVVFGIGATTYQATTRDTLGFVSKITAAQKTDGSDRRAWIDVMKDPITDRSKKSLTGRFVGNKDLIRIY